MIGILQHLQRSARLIAPYFQTYGNVQSNRILLATYFVGKVAKAVVVAMLYSYLSGFMGVLSLPVITYSLFFQQLLGFLGNLCLLGAFESLDYYVSHKIKFSLQTSLNDDLSQRWLSHSSLFGVKVIPGAQQVDPNKVLRDDTYEFIENSIKLLDDALSLGFAFGLGVYHLWIHSITLTLSVLGREVAVPGLMAIGSVFYALAYNTLSSHINKDFPELCREEKLKDAQMQNVIFHIDNNREAIVLQDTAQKEMGFYQKAYQELLHIRNKILHNKTQANFLKLLHENLSDIIGVLLATPSIIAKKIQVTDVFENNYHFKSIIHFFTATQSNIKTLTHLQTSIQRIEHFKEAISLWEHQPRLTPLLSSTEPFYIQNLNVSTPDGRTLLENASVRFEPNQVTLIQGPTGHGKSTLIKTLAGVWPFSDGKCSIPCEPDEMHIIPQKPCLPYQATLLEALTYPLNSAPVDRSFIENSMRTLGLQDKIDMLDETADWTQRLSGGELQRVALLGAVLKKPKILLLDESLSALDTQTKEKAQQFLKEELPETTLLVIDHQPKLQSKSMTPFYDSLLNLDDQKLTATPLQPPSLNSPKM